MKYDCDQFSGTEKILCIFGLTREVVHSGIVWRKKYGNFTVSFLHDKEAVRKGWEVVLFSDVGQKLACDGSNLPMSIDNTYFAHELQREVNRLNTSVRMWGGQCRQLLQALEQRSV